MPRLTCADFRLHSLIRRRSDNISVKTKCHTKTNENVKMVTISRYSIIKFLELAIAIICIWLHHESKNTGDFATDFLSATAFGGFAIILIGGAVGHMMGSPITRRIDIFFCLAGVAVFVAAGALNIKHYENMYKSSIRDYGLSKGSLAIINGVLFLLDSLITWRGDY